MAAEAFLCGYYAVFVALMVAFAALVIPLARRQWADPRYWIAMLSAVAVAGALALPLFFQYVRLQHATGFGRSLAEARQWSAIWRTYFASSAYLHAWMLPLIGHWNEVLFPGFAATLGGLWGFRSEWLAGGRRREVSLLYGSLAALAFWLSFGPAAGLYTVLAAVPAFGLMRAPSRFGIIVAMSLCVLAGLSIRAALRRLERAGQREGRLATVVAGVIALAAMLELAAPLSFSPVAPIDTAYRVLATLPRGPTLELPVYSAPFATERTKYMLSSTVQWMPLVNAIISYIPQDIIDRRDTLALFPSREAFKLLERDRVRYAVFHMDLLTAEARVAVQERIREFQPYLRCHYADDRIWLYEIVAFPD